MWNILIHIFWLLFFLLSFTVMLREEERKIAFRPSGQQTSNDSNEVVDGERASARERDSNVADRSLCCSSISIRRCSWRGRASTTSSWIVVDADECVGDDDDEPRAMTSTIQVRRWKSLSSDTVSQSGDGDVPRRDSDAVTCSKTNRESLERSHRREQRVLPEEQRMLDHRRHHHRARHFRLVHQVYRR